MMSFSCWTHFLGLPAHIYNPNTLNIRPQNLTPTCFSELLIPFPLCFYSSLLGFFCSWSLMGSVQPQNLCSCLWFKISYQGFARLFSSQSSYFSSKITFSWKCYPIPCNLKAAHCLLVILFWATCFVFSFIALITI